MEEFKLDSLNSEQLVPVTDTEGAVLVTAGAGSGKTRMLTHRIAYLISERKVSPYNILAITFTNKAASEMKERLYTMIPDSQGLWVSTFHSMCVMILRRFIDHIGYTSNFSIYTETEKERIIKKYLKDHRMEDDNGLSRRISSCISDAKNEGYSPNEYQKINKYMNDIVLISQIYAEYERELRRCNALDFDDLLLYAHRLLTESKEAREHYQKRFWYIHVDEFQDTNTIQYKLLIQLAAKHRNIFAVGDEDQCIYGWRGANIDNIRNFIKDYGAKIYKLEQNYRSTSKIIEAANSLIGKNTMRIEKQLWTDNEEGMDIMYYAAQRDSDEADYVISSITSLRGKGYRYSDIAILMRVNALSRGFEQKLLQYNLPYKVFGGFKFFERKEVKDILAYARMVCNPSDDEAVLRIINFPKRGIGDAAIKQLANYASVMGISLTQAVINIEKNPDLPTALISKIKPFSQIVRRLYQKKDLPPHLFLSEIVDSISLKQLYAEPTEENQNRIMHIDQLIESAMEYYLQNEHADIADYLQMITLYTDTDEIDENKDYISVATVHSAKGLEFKVVFIVGLEEGLFPLSRAAEDNHELEEERRLMYVAITRAKKRLYMTRSRTRFLYGSIKDTLASRFLEEAGISTMRRNSQMENYRSNSYSQNSYNLATSNQSSYGYNSNGYGGYAQKQQTKQNDSNTYGTKSSSGFGVDSIQKRQAKTENKQLQSGFSIVSQPKVQTKSVCEFKVGSRVRHKRFGEGKILSISTSGNYFAEVEFASGKMTLALSFAPLEIIDSNNE